MNRLYSAFTRLCVSPVKASTSFAAPILNTFPTNIVSISSGIKVIHTTVPSFRNNYLQSLKQWGPIKHRPNRRDRNKVSPGQAAIPAVILRLQIKRPLKPNSGNKKTAWVRTAMGKKVLCYIPGEGHNLQEHSKVAIEGKRKKDIIGCKARIIRGRFDCNVPKRGIIFKRVRITKKLKFKLQNKSKRIRISHREPKEPGRMDW